MAASVLAARTDQRALAARSLHPRSGVVLTDRPTKACAQVRYHHNAGRGGWSPPITPVRRRWRLISISPKLEIRPT